MAHLHIAARFAAAYRRAIEARMPVDPESDLERTQPMTVINCFERSVPQRPAYPAGWDWVTPSEWEAMHGGREDR